MEDEYSRWLPATYTLGNFTCPVCGTCIELGPFNVNTIKQYRYCPFCANRLMPPKEEE